MKVLYSLISVAAIILLSGNALAGDGVLVDHPAVTVAGTGAHPDYQDGMKVYGHPAGGNSVAAPARSALNEHPSVTVMRTGAHPGYQDAMKVYGHPARGMLAVPTANADTSTP